MSTCFVLPDEGASIHLITHLVVREDQHTLYGFASEGERRLFRDLLKVNRVGAKLALGILSGISVDGFARCVQQQKPSIVGLPGRQLAAGRADRVSSQ